MPSESVEEYRKSQSYGIGVLLVILGVLLLLVVFVAGFQTYRSYNLNVNVSDSNAVQVLGISAQILIKLLIKIAFLGVSLAAGSIILSKGVDLIRNCPNNK